MGHVQSMLSMPQVGHLSLGIVGLQSYYKYLKDGRNGEFKVRQQITSVLYRF